MTVMRFTAGAGLQLDISGEAGADKGTLDPGRATVVVPTRNDQDTIGRCLGSILAQRGVDLQVIVVDGGSVDRTVETVRRHLDADPRVELLVSPRDTTAQLLNVGLWAARGRWLIQVDPRSTIPENYVRTVVSHLESGLWTGAGGRDEPVGDTPTGRAIAATDASPSGRSPTGRSAHVASVNRLRAGGYPTSLLRAIGGWDERIAAGEEVEMNHRLRRQGYRLMVDAGLSVSRRCAHSLRDVFAESRARGRGLGRLLRYRIKAVASRDVFMPALLCLLVLALPMDLLSPDVAILMAAAYPVAMIATMIPVARRLSAPATARVPLALLCMHAGTAAGAIEGISRPTLERLRALIPGVA